jgi:homoserine kinase
MVRVRVPASTSNLGPGFDCLGLALDLVLEVEAETAAETHISLAGMDADLLPRDESNLVLACARRALSARSAVGLRLAIRNSIPVGRGLGSSGAAIVAGLLAGKLLGGRSIERMDLLAEAAEIEGHPDNVAPAVLGGLVVCACEPGRVQAIPVPWPADVEIVALVPEARVTTEAARAVLPDRVPLADAVFELQHAALLVAALAQGRTDVLRGAMQDRLHEDRRLALVPGLAAAYAALSSEPGCLGVAVSGSGPTLLALCRTPGAGFGRSAVDAQAAGGGGPATIRPLRVHPAGARWDLGPDPQRA